MSTSSSLPRHVGTLSKGDLIAASPGTKPDGTELSPVVMQVKKVLNGSVRAVLMKDVHFAPQTVDVPNGSVIANFGDAKSGKAFGTDFSNVFRQSREHPRFGDVHYFYEVDEEGDDLRFFLKGLTRAAKVFDQHGLSFLYDGTLPIVFEAIRKSGPVGMFIWPGKDIDERPARCQINSGGLKGKNALVDDYIYVVLHELSHALEFFYLRMSPTLIGNWTHEYAKCTECDVPTSQELIALKRVFLDSESLKEAHSRNRSSEDPERATRTLKVVLSYLSRVRGIRPKDLGPLLSDEDARSDRLDAIWPRVNDLLPFKITEPVVSEYATTNPSEFIAETFTHYFLGRLSNKRLNKLVERSIQYVLKQHKILGQALDENEKIASLVKPVFEEAHKEQDHEAE